MRRLALILAATLALTGCFEEEKQTVVDKDHVQKVEKEAHERFQKFVGERPQYKPLPKDAFNPPANKQ